MKNLIRAEETGFFLLALYFYFDLHYPWWLFFALLFMPDISMIGYLVNNKAGAILYNAIHFRGLAILLYIIGIAMDMPSVALAGTILFAHSSLDRALGYGLKQYEGFKFTHLGNL